MNSCLLNRHIAIEGSARTALSPNGVLNRGLCNHQRIVLWSPAWLRLPSAAKNYRWSRARATSSG